MKERCLVPGAVGYERYGGVGVRIHPAWIHDFQQFLVDVGERPNRHMTLDRYPNGSGDYVPGNVRWASKREQVINRKCTLRLTYNGVTKPLVDWAIEVNLPRSTIASRLKQGWSVEQTLTTPHTRPQCRRDAKKPPS